jgi:hypothetical protein
MDLESLVYLQPDQVSCQLGDDHVILNLSTGVYFGVNDLGSFIWKAIHGAQPVRDIRDAVLAQYDVTSERCEQDLFALLSRLSAERLIEIREPLAS